MDCVHSPSFLSSLIAGFPFGFSVRFYFGFPYEERTLCPNYMFWSNEFGVQLMPFQALPCKVGRIFFTITDWILTHRPFMDLALNYFTLKLVDYMINKHIVSGFREKLAKSNVISFLHGSLSTICHSSLKCNFFFLLDYAVLSHNDEAAFIVDEGSILFFFIVAFAKFAFYI